MAATGTRRCWRWKASGSPRSPSRRSSTTTAWARGTTAGWRWSSGTPRQAIEITPEQAAFLEKLNPCFRERHVESAAPGELLSADTFFVGTLKGVGRVYLHAVVDTYGSYAFGFLHVSKQPEAAVAVLHNDVLPFYRNLDLPVGAVLTDNGREFCGTERHPYELYLELNGIEHRRTRVRTPKTNGFVERFNGTVLDEFFRVKMRETFYESVEALQADLDAWLDPLQHRAAASGIPQHGPTAHRNRHVIRQPRRLSGHLGHLGSVSSVIFFPEDAGRCRPHGLRYLNSLSPTVRPSRPGPGHPNP